MLKKSRRRKSPIRKRSRSVRKSRARKSRARKSPIRKRSRSVRKSRARKSHIRKSRKCKKSQFRSRKSGYCRKRKCSSGRTRDIVTRLCRNKKSRRSRRRKSPVRKLSLRKRSLRKRSLRKSRRRKSQLRNNYSPKRGATTDEKGAKKENKDEKGAKKENKDEKGARASASAINKKGKAIAINKKGGTKIAEEAIKEAIDDTDEHGKKYTKEQLRTRMIDNLESNYTTICLGRTAKMKKTNSLNTHILNLLHTYSPIDPVTRELIILTDQVRINLLKEKISYFLSDDLSHLFKCDKDDKRPIGGRLYRCVSSANLDYIAEQIAEQIDQDITIISTLHPEKLNQSYSIKKWISQGSKEYYDGGQYSSASLDYDLITKEGSNICGKEVPSKGNKKVTVISNVECLLCINIFKFVQIYNGTLRVIMPSLTENESDIVYTTIGPNPNIPFHTPRSSQYKEIQPGELHLDIYPAFNPILLKKWFGFDIDRITIGISAQNTAFAAISAQEVIMSGNYPIEILDVLAYYTYTNTKDKSTLKLTWPKTPIPLKDYLKDRQTYRSGDNPGNPDPMEQ